MPYQSLIDNTRLLNQIKDTASVEYGTSSTRHTKEISMIKNQTLIGGIKHGLILINIQIIQITVHIVGQALIQTFHVRIHQNRYII